MNPTIVNVMAASLDGLISSHPTEPDFERFDSGFTCESDRDFVRSELASADAVIVGANSIRASQGLWEIRNTNGRYPDWYVYSNSGLDPALPFWRQANTARHIVSRSPVAVPPEVGNIVYGSGPPGATLVEHLKRRNRYDKVLLFGGGQINRIFYNEGLVDYLNITISPRLIGSDTGSRLLDPGLDAHVRLLLKSSQANGNHVFLSYKVQQ